MGENRTYVEEMKETASEPTFMVCERVVGYISSTSCFIAAVPRNRSNWVPGGSNPKGMAEHFQNNISKTLI